MNFNQGLRTANKHMVTIALLVFVYGSSGCATQKKILVQSYSAPKEYEKIERMRTSDTHADGKYLTLSIDPDIGMPASAVNDSTVPNRIINNIKGLLTETNFISIHPAFDSEGNILKMVVTDYQYKALEHEIIANMTVSFTLTQGINEFYSENYHAKEVRYSKSGQGLPSQAEIDALMTKKCTTQFVRDISPTKVMQLRVLKPFPKKLEYVAEYARRKNYDGAIKAMGGYSGNKDAGFHYNLAILHEALASGLGDIKHLTMANEQYELAMSNGGADDEDIISSKARFDSFYRLFSKVEAQVSTNRGRQKELQQEFGLE